MNKPKLLAAALVFAVFGLIALPAMAQSEGAIKHRKTVMKTIGGHVSAIFGILRGQANYPNGLKIHAHALADLAMVAPHISPEGSDFGETNAKEEIWSKPGEFKKALQVFQMETAKLAKIADGGDMKAFGAQAKAVGKNACTACHDTFRKKMK